jgi:hypothetical protein
MIWMSRNKMAYPVLLVNIPFFYAKNFKKKYWFLKIFGGIILMQFHLKGLTI